MEIAASHHKSLQQVGILKHANEMLIYAIEGNPFFFHIFAKNKTLYNDFYFFLVFEGTAGNSIL
jgi:hypothetical protein